MNCYFFIFLTTLYSSSYSVEADCVDYYGRNITEGVVYVPTEDRCVLCKCVNSTRGRCSIIPCSVEVCTNVKDRCCDYRCVEDSDPSYVPPPKRYTGFWFWRKEVEEVTEDDSYYGPESPNYVMDQSTMDPSEFIIGPPDSMLESTTGTLDFLKDVTDGYYNKEEEDEEEEEEEEEEDKPKKKKPLWKRFLAHIGQILFAN